jgi:pimeloyl-ACP methyl ester carboxylesterase
MRHFWLAVFAPLIALWVSLSCQPAAARSLQFRPCKDASSFPELSGSVCAAYEVPLRAPGTAVGTAADTLDLFVRKFPASGRSKGTLWLIAGGPGESGASFYPFLGTLRRAFAGFDLVVPDHRGTGYSTRLCPKEEELSSQDGMALAGAEWGSCWQALNSAPDYARAFSITNAAHDLADLIAAYRSSVPSYLYGVSYGTQLVLRTFQIAQPAMNGVILDSLVPPETSTVWDLSHRSQIVDGVGRRVLGDRAAVYEKLIASANAAALGDPKIFFGSLLDFPSTRARIPDLIAGLNRGDDAVLVPVKTTLTQIGNVLTRYPQSPPSIPLVSIISVSENDARPAMTKADVAKEEEKLLFSASLPGLLVNPGLPLYSKDTFFGGEPKALPRTLVLQGTLDPKTPLEGAQAHIAELKGVGQVSLVLVSGSPHFVLMTSPDCFEQAAKSFVAGRAIRAPSCASPRFRKGF